MGQKQLCNVPKELKNNCQYCTRFGGDHIPSTVKKFPLPRRISSRLAATSWSCQEESVSSEPPFYQWAGPGERQQCVAPEELLLLLGLDRGVGGSKLLVWTKIRGGGY